MFYVTTHFMSSNTITYLTMPPYNSVETQSPIKRLQATIKTPVCETYSKLIIKNTNALWVYYNLFQIILLITMSLFSYDFFIHLLSCVRSSTATMEIFHLLAVSVNLYNLFSVTDYCIVPSAIRPRFSEFLIF